MAAFSARKNFLNQYPPVIIDMVSKCSLLAGLSDGLQEDLNMKTESAEEIAELTDREIEDAMGDVEGFIDITPEDFQKVYRIAYRRALTGQSVISAPEKVKNLEVSSPGYWAKIFQSISEPAPRVSWKEIGWSWLGAFLGIGVVAWLHYKILSSADLALVVGSFGASAVLIYGAIRSPLAQPRNLIGGHVFSAIIGVVSWKLFSFEPWLAGAIAVSTSIAFMHYTRTLHPPGGATALIAVIGSDTIHNLGFLYVLIPIFTGALLMLIVALLINNAVSWRKYPEFWW